MNDSQDTPSLPPNAQSLAPELVCQILKIAADLEDKWFNGSRWDRRLYVLYRASLVCRIWRFEAQLLLWKKIYLGDEAQAQLILASPALGTYRTRELTVEGVTNWSKVESR